MAALPPRQEKCPALQVMEEKTSPKRESTPKNHYNMGLESFFSKFSSLEQK
jgi:hypothetical protein